MQPAFEPLEELAEVWQSGQTVPRGESRIIVAQTWYSALYRIESSTNML